MKNAASVKDRLYNISKKTGKTMQELLVAYGLERTIYRLSVSRYKDNFTLKGGILLYALFDGNYARATTDIDLRAEKISNDIEGMKQVFEDIFSIEVDDPISFDLNSLSVKSITEFKKYHGVNVSILGFLDKTRIDVSIDVGFGDTIYPKRIEMDFPSVLDDESPRIYAYSEVSSISEKFEAIVSLAYENTRFKDFYDIYVLSTTRDYDGKEMTEAVKETFEHRNTSLEEIVAFEEDFANDPLRQSRWNSFIKKKKAIITISLEEVVSTIKVFLEPISEAIKGDIAFDKSWSHNDGKWL